MDYVRNKHSNLTILGNLLPYLPDKNFGDCEHVNPSGAVAFSEAVATLLAAAIPQEREASRLR
jgi:hypothetical protein